MDHLTNGQLPVAQSSNDALKGRVPMTPTQSIPSRSMSRASLTRNMSYNEMLAPPVRTEAKVLVIYTGGTIGMMRNEKRGMCKSSQFITEKNELHNFITIDLINTCRHFSGAYAESDK